MLLHNRLSHCDVIFKFSYIFIIVLDYVTSLTSTCTQKHQFTFHLKSFLCNPGVSFPGCDLIFRAIVNGTDSKLLFDNLNNEDVLRDGAPTEFVHTFQKDETNLSLVIQFLEEDGIPHNLDDSHKDYVVNMLDKAIIGIDQGYGEDEKVKECIYENNHIIPTQNTHCIDQDGKINEATFRQTIDCSKRVKYIEYQFCVTVEREDCTTSTSTTSTKSITYTNTTSTTQFRPTTIEKITTGSDESSSLVYSAGTNTTSAGISDTGSKSSSIVACEKNLDSRGVIKNISIGGTSATFECPIGYAINNRRSITIICHAGIWKYVQQPMVNLTCEQATVIFNKKIEPNEEKWFWKQINDCITNGTCQNREDALQRWFPTAEQGKKTTPKHPEGSISSRTAGFIVMILGLLTAASALVELVVYIKKIRAANVEREAAGQSDDESSLGDDEEYEYYYEEVEVDEFYLPLASES